MLGHATVVAGGADLGTRCAALGPGAAAQPRESGVSIRSGRGTEARSREAASEGGGRGQSPRAATEAVASGAPIPDPQHLGRVGASL